MKTNIACGNIVMQPTNILLSLVVYLFKLARTMTFKKYLAYLKRKIVFITENKHLVYIDNYGVQ